MNFKGIFLKMGVFHDDGSVNDYVVLNTFGNVQPPYCKTYTFKADEYISEMSFIYTEGLVEGFEFATNQNKLFKSGSSKSSGNQSTKVSFTKDTPFIGFEGSMTSQSVLSLGAINLKNDTQNCTFTDPLPVELIVNTGVAKPLETAPVVQSDSWKIALIVAASVIALIGLIALLVVCIRRRKSKTGPETVPVEFMPDQTHPGDEMGYERAAKDTAPDDGMKPSKPTVTPESEETVTSKALNRKK
jgi:hypothetical protein